MIQQQADMYIGTFCPELGNNSYAMTLVANTSQNLPFVPQKQVLVTVLGSTAAFIQFDPNPVTVVVPTSSTPTNGICVLGNTTQSFTPPAGASNMGAISSGTPTIYLTVGEGI
jgi:hypothetical protein